MDKECADYYWMFFRWSYLKQHEYTNKRKIFVTMRRMTNNQMNDEMNNKKINKRKGEINFGSLVISLDFELMWGIIDRSNPLEYEKNLNGVRRAIPLILNIFEMNNIHATWGVVGLLARESIEESIATIPFHIPQYTDKRLSSYEHFDEANNYNKNYLFAKDLIREIAATPNQEIGSHTYSHYYCLEDGSDKESFNDDIELAKEALKDFNNNITTLIFPRNQINADFTGIMKDQQIKNYRGTESAWYYRPENEHGLSLYLKKIFRLLDSYINLAGDECYGYNEICDRNGLNNIRSSRFLRPYSEKLAKLERIRLHRIKMQMKHAAQRHQVFHMWWHPHNFGINIEQNIDNLKQLIDYYALLNKKYGMKSLNMNEIGELINENNGVM